MSTSIEPAPSAVGVGWHTTGELVSLHPRPSSQVGEVGIERQVSANESGERKSVRYLRKQTVSIPYPNREFVSGVSVYKRSAEKDTVAAKRKSVRKRSRNHRHRIYRRITFSYRVRVCVEDASELAVRASPVIVGPIG